MPGLFIVDKPEGPTSFDAVAKARKAFGTREVGHAGTLDPLASGVLVLLIGSWTRLVPVLERDDKRYQARISFGAQTATDDREGAVLRSVPDAEVRARVDEARVRAALPAFLGEQLQRPPAYAAIKQGGEKLYDKARRGEVVDAPPRKITIHAIELLSFVHPHAVLDVHCGKGTYIRALARDLGDRLGVPAHLAGLVRTKSGGYPLEEAAPWSALLDAEQARARLLTSVRDVRGVPLLPVDADDERRLRHGGHIRSRAPLGGAPLVGTGLAFRADDERTPVALVRQDGDSLAVVRGFPLPV